MEFVIGVLALLFVLFVTFGVIAAVRVTRAVQRGVERTGSQVRRTVEDTALRAKSAQPGPVGELARKRLELRASIDGTRRALESDVTQDPSLQEAVGLLDRLHEHARHLDGELRLLMEREPDKARTAARLPEVRERVARIKQSADSLRFAAQDRASRHDADGLDALREQIEIESGALRHWQSPEELDPPREEQAGLEQARAEQPRVEPPRAEQAHAEPPRAEHPRAEHPRGEHPRLDKGRPQSAP